MSNRSSKAEGHSPSSSVTAVEQSSTQAVPAVLLRHKKIPKDRALIRSTYPVKDGNHAA